MCTARQFAAPRAAAATVTLLVVVLAGCGGDARVVGPGSPSATVEPPLAAFAASEWSEPVNLGAPVNSSERDQNASLADDGLTLYFASNREHGGLDLDIYVAHRATLDSPWEEPINLGPVVNSTAFELAPKVSPDGHLLFFSTNKPGGEGNADIYVSYRGNPNDDFGWETPVNVGPPVNTPDAETSAMFVESAEEGTANLYIARGSQSATAPPGTSPWSDIFVASVSRSTGRALGEVKRVDELNSELNDAAPTVRRDGREIFFGSSRAGSMGSEIWTSTRRSVREPWAVPTVVSPLYSAYNDGGPNLSHDGRTLFFHSNRPEGLGGLDIWMSTRTPQP